MSNVATLLFFIVIFILAIIATLFLKSTIEDFNKAFVSSIEKNKEALKNLQQFSYDTVFEPFPDTIEITNPYPCSGSELKPCKLDDFTTCFGCQSLIASCVHMEKDVEYVDPDGKKSIIPANETENDGYCLTINNPGQLCNKYHGSFVLVQLRPEDSESILICDCKNPGFIGKTQLDGACDSVFICNGEIDDINKPLEEINCKCSPGYSNIKLDDMVPTCQIDSVQNYEGYDTLFTDKETAPINNFSANISSNFPGSKLVNPCRYCALTGEFIENGEMVSTPDGYQCALISQKPSSSSGIQGIPIKLKQTGDRNLKGKEGPDAIINIYWKHVNTYGYTEDSKYENMAIYFDAGSEKNKKIAELLNLDKSKHYALNAKGHDLVYPGHFGNANFTETHNPYCMGEWPSYECWISSNVGYNGPYDHFENNLKYKAYRGTDIPGSFLWGKETWRDVELVNEIIEATERWQVNGTVKFQTNPSFQDSGYFRFLFWHFDPLNALFVPFMTGSIDQHREYLSQIIPGSKEEWDE